ncbi:MAG TPA: DNA internalization-related competence protein ComEC/Rec2 [Gammaproteobacteria bacterium]|nr:DNA internalization-related competence protein ComEC/Rec2 [Gammaproteobacteria bacterium]
MPVLVLFYTAGILLAQLPATLLPAGRTAGLLVAAGLLALLRRRRAWYLAAVLGGFAWAGLYAGHLLARRLPGREGRPIDCRAAGRVASIPVRRGHRTRFVLRVLRAGPGCARGGMAAGQLLRLSWYGAGRAPAPGERWSAPVRVWAPHGFMNPGGFDYERWLFLHRVDATGYVRDAHAARHLAPAGGAEPVLRLRSGIDRRLAAELPDDAASGVIRALATGYRGAIRPSTWDLLTRTGTVHLVAISGLHVGLVTALVLLLAGGLWSLSLRATDRVPARRVAAPAAWLAAAGYALLAGFTIPTRRALVMLTVGLGALWWRRRPDPLRTLTGALFAVLALEPTAVLAPGLWLSFGAVAFILYGMVGRVRVPGRAGAAVRVQLLVSAGLFPLTLLFFGRASWIAPVANLLMVPLFGILVVPLVLAGVALLGPWPFAARGLLHLAHGILAACWPLLASLGRIAGPGLQLAPLSPARACLAALGAALLLTPRGAPGRLAGAVIAVAACWPQVSAPPAGVARVAVLDVGQGLATVVRTRRHVLVYDTGPDFASGGSAGAAVIAPYLRALGVTRIDRVIVSHSDRDHAGGLHDLRRAFPVGDVEMGGGGHLADGARRCLAGQHWRWDGIRFAILHPAPGSHLRGNDASCVLHVAGHGESMLLTGDLERAGERELASRASGRLRADVLQVPHHGSRTSSTPAFLRLVDPVAAVVSAGWGNRYNLPSGQVLARYAERHVPVFNTARDGALLWHIGGRGPGSGPVCWRARHERYWSARIEPDRGCRARFGR